MKLIVGLGNPGAEYEHTRHNMGFMAIDALVTAWGFTIKKNNFSGEYWEGQAPDGEKVFLFKPLTFMNLSGTAVVQMKNFYKIPLQDIIVIYDDKDVEFGKIKIKPNGSGAGHNGIKDIVQKLGTEQFTRIKVGIGKDPKISMVNWVLGKIPNQQLPVVQATNQHIIQALTKLVFDHQSLTKIMSLFN